MIPLRGVVPFLVVWFTFDAVKNFNMTVSSGLRRRKVIAFASLIDYVLRIFLLYLLYKLTLLSTSSVIALLATSSFTVCIYYFWRYHDNFVCFRIHDIRNILYETFVFSWPFFIWGGFSWLQNMVNRWLLSWFSDLSTVAEFSILISISTFPVMALLGVISTYAIPIIYEGENNKAGFSNHFVKKIAILLIPLYAFMVFISLIWHQEIISILSDSSYAKNSVYLPIIVFALSVSSICSVFTYAVFAQRKSKRLILANTLPGIFSLAFGVVIVPKYFLLGSIITFCLSHIIAAILYGITFIRLRLSTTSN